MKSPFKFPKTYSAVLAAACLLLAQGATLRADTSHLILTEVNSNAAGGDFWELTNVGTTAVSLGNFKWDDESQNPNDAAAVTIPAGTSIAAGESIIFSVGSASTFRAQWGTLPGVQIITGGPGLGPNDGVALFDAAGTKLFYFSYASGGFTRSNGSSSQGGHAGASAGGGSDDKSVVIDPSFGVGSGVRYAAATAGTFGAYANATGGQNIGSPGTASLSPLILTEINSNATGGDFWELTNVGTFPVRIGNWKWIDSNRSPTHADVITLPAGTTIAAGESIVLSIATNVTTFRNTWGGLAGVQVFGSSSGEPGLGKNDGVALYDTSNTEVFYFSYASGGFTRSSGSGAAGEHAGPSAGGSSDSQSAVLDPTFGTGSGKRYAAAAVGTYGAYVSTAGGSNIGSPGKINATSASATVSLANASVTEGNSGSATLALTVTRSSTTTAFTVGYAVTGGTATGGTDYATPVSGTLTFANGGAATQTINISVTGDTTGELDETVVVTLSNVVNTTGTTTIDTATGTGTILNDDATAPTITTHPANTSIPSGGTTMLSVAASGSPTPTYQWYAGNSGDTSNPVSGATSSSFTTPALTTAASYWARATNTGGSANSNTATVTISTGVVSVNLANYVRVGRYGLPEPTRTALPAGTASHNLLCQEASGVTYNWDTDTLFIACDGGRSITQVSKTGALINTMTLALGSSPQGTEFYDIEGITYIGGGQFVMSEERDRQLVKFTYVAGTTLSRSGAQTVKIGTFVENTGTEGLSYDPQTGGYICLREVSPLGIFQTGVNFAAGTATNGSASTTNSTNLFNPALTGMTDFADVFAFSNIPSMSGQPQAGNLLLLGQEDARVVNIDRSGNILSTLNITSDAGNPLTAAAQQHEGITMDRAGNIYIVNENGGGDIDHPQLWVYASSVQANEPPTAVVVNNAVTSIQENSSTAAAVKVGDIVVTDDGLGTNVLSLSGADAGVFELNGSALYLKAGTVLDYETKTSYAVTINANDTTVGATPDATVNFTLTVADQAVETPPAPAVIISEVAPWSSNGGVGGDWFEVTNVSANAVTITGWKVDDSSPAFASAIALNGITSIAPGESVIFVEGAAAIADTFKTNWFGGSPPAGLQVGTYSGTGIGLGTSGDAVNLYNAAGVLQASVSFGAADSTAPLSTFDNTAGLNATAISTLSAVGVHGAVGAVNNANEVGSPGYSAPGDLRITEVAAWGSGDSPAAADWFEVTNIGGRAVDMTGWKMDDSSESPVGALALTGITSIAPGESVIYLETATLAATRATFLSTWFGANPPAGLQVGGYTGSGAGLSTGSDAVNLFDSTNVRRVNVAFGSSPASAPFASFDNAAGVNVGMISQLSAAGVNGAFAAVNDTTEIGSPGSSTASGPLTFAAWLAVNGYSGAVGGDTDSDGMPDTLEYFFNTNPNNSTNDGNLPQIVKNSADLEFRFSYLNTSVFSGYLECSDDLVRWTNATPGTDYEVITETTNGSVTAVRYRIFTQPISRRFFRVGVDTTP